MKRGTKDLVLTMMDCERRLVSAGLWETVKAQREALRVLQVELSDTYPGRGSSMKPEPHEEDQGFDGNGDLI